MRIHHIQYLVEFSMKTDRFELQPSRISLLSDNMISLKLYLTNCQGVLNITIQKWIKRA